ncbi:MAG: hypothetical protein O3C40_17405 [Planctomycetota bacterium]|nr:hypothetical protein [Planctomycetota bacterium]
MKRQIDLEAALLDFKSAYESDHDKALNELLCLLLDPAACETRLIVLDELRSRAERQPGFTAAGKTSPERLQQLIDIIATDGPVPALEASKITIDELDAITWNVAALREVHDKLLRVPEQPDSPVDETSVEGNTAYDISRLWRLGSVELIRPRLESCMPGLLSCLDAPESLAPQATDYILSQPYDPNVKSFRAFVSAALLQFVQQHTGEVSPLDDGDWRRVLVRSAATAVLRPFREPDGVKNHPQWVVEFCQTVSTERMNSAEDVLAWEPPLSASVEQVAAFRYSLYEHICGTERELLAAWQLSS